MKIRELNSLDARTFMDIRLEALANSPESFGESLEEALCRSSDDFESILSDHGKGDFVLGLFSDGVIIGIAGYYREGPAKLSHKGNIWGVYIKPAYRGSGYGAVLLGKVIELAKMRSDVQQLNLTVVTSNPAAINTYKKLGFVVYGTEPQAMAVSGIYYDKHHMKLFLWAAANN